MTVDASNDENDEISASTVNSALCTGNLEDDVGYSQHQDRQRRILQQLDNEVPSDSNQSSSEPDRTRRFNILSILPLTTNPSTDPNGKRTPIDFRIDIEASGWLAYYHYSNRSYSSSGNYTVLPHIHERLSKCDITFQYSMRDSKFSPIYAAREFTEAYGSSSSSEVYSSYSSNTTYPEGSLLDDLQEILLNVTTKEQRDKLTRPNGIVGSARSAVSSVIGYLTSTKSIPQISSSSTAEYLNNKDIYSTFARTITTNAGDAQAMAIYLKFLNVSHVAILFINDGYGNDFHSDLVKAVTAFNISVVSEPYDDLSIERSVRKVSSSQLKYVIAILNPSTWREVLTFANQYNVIGRPDYFWIFGESSLQFTTASFKLNRTSEADIARALHGSAVVSVTEFPYDPFDLALSSFKADEALRSLYISQHVEPEIFDNYTFALPSRTIYQYLTYDAVIALMLAACETPLSNVDDFSDYGSLVYQQLLRTEFDGVSGTVAFDPNTGTRISKGLTYSVQNIQFPDNLVNEDIFQVSSTITNIVTLPELSTSSVDHWSLLQSVKEIVPLYFASNATIPPLPLPPVSIDLNLIPSGIRIFCLLLCGINMVTSVWWMLWTLMHRNKDVVKASQPIFLCQLCAGTFIIASSIIPMSLQEPISTRGLDIACMLTPWLVSMGFVTAFSALLTKTWRLNKLFHHSRSLRRIVVKPRDVLLPFIVLISMNICVMTAWTIDAPLSWERKLLGNYDKFNRSVESFGRCTPSDTKRTTIYLIVIAAINFSVVLLATYQTYKSRNLPIEFSESTYITISIGSILEVFILGAPLLFLASSDPTTNFLIRSILVSVTCLSTLLPIFLPKYFRRSVNKRYHDTIVATTGAAPITSRVHISIGGGSAHLPGLDVDGHDSNLGGQLERGMSKVQRSQDYYKELASSTTRRTSFKDSEYSSGQFGSGMFTTISQFQGEVSGSPVPAAGRRNSRLLQIVATNGIEPMRRKSINEHNQADGEVNGSPVPSSGRRNSRLLQIVATNGTEPKRRQSINERNEADASNKGV